MGMFPIPVEVTFDLFPLGYPSTAEQYTCSRAPSIFSKGTTYTVFIFK